MNLSLLAVAIMSAAESDKSVNIFVGFIEYSVIMLVKILLISSEPSFEPSASLRAITLVSVSPFGYAKNRATPNLRPVVELQASELAVINMAFWIFCLMQLLINVSVEFTCSLMIGRDGRSGMSVLSNGSANAIKAM